ncbi:DsrE family protein [Saliniradius amylolyticus]|nr:DsrE family protein [Saliniradius amylolyticus]
MFKRFFVAALVLSPMAGAEPPPEFPVLAEFGGNYWVETNQPLPADTQFKVAFDVGDGAEPGKLNYNIHSLARFLNMHVRHGVARDNIQLALVVHGKATKDLLTNAHYQQEFGTDNGSEALIQALLNNNTQVYVCGQSANHYGVTQDKLIDGVQISLSAMTQHALLQQQGYTLNPF